MELIASRIGPLACDNILGEALLGGSTGAVPSSISFATVAKLDPIRIGSPALVQQLECDSPGSGTRTHVFNWPMRATIQQMRDPNFTYNALRLCEANGLTSEVIVTCNTSLNRTLRGFEPRTCTYLNTVGLRRTASINISCM